MESQQRSRLRALSALILMTAVTAGFAHYTTAGGCKVLVESQACYEVEGGMGVECFNAPTGTT